MLCKNYISIMTWNILISLVIYCYSLPNFSPASGAVTYFPL